MFCSPDPGPDQGPHELAWRRSSSRTTSRISQGPHTAGVVTNNLVLIIRSDEI